MIFGPPLPPSMPPAQTIAAGMSYKSPFAAPLDKQDEMERARRALAAPSQDESASGDGAAKHRAHQGGKRGVGEAGASALPPTIAAGQQSDHLLLVAAFDLWHVALQAGGRAAASKVGGRRR